MELFPTQSWHTSPAHCQATALTAQFRLQQLKSTSGQLDFQCVRQLPSEMLLKYTRFPEDIHCLLPSGISRVFPIDSTNPSLTLDQSKFLPGPLEYHCAIIMQYNSVSSACNPSHFYEGSAQLKKSFLLPPISLFSALENPSGSNEDIFIAHENCNN